MRLDRMLVARGFYDTRAKARDAVLRGAVAIDGAVATRPGASVSETARVALDDPAHRYVSRAALKLAHGLAAFAIPVAGRVGLDIGAATGGFTQVLLENGARLVFALDVGHGQLADNVASDRRVVAFEGVNARDISPALFSDPIEVVVCDVSFISLTLALPAALDLAANGAHLVALIKPQFEAGRAAIGRTGVVKDVKVQEKVCDDIAGWLAGRPGWRVLGLEPSPIAGSDGNREFLIAAGKRQP